MTPQLPLEFMLLFTQEFLEAEAQRQDLTQRETDALVARLSCQEGKLTLPDEATVILEILHITDKTLDAHFTRIDEKFGLVGQ